MNLNDIIYEGNEKRKDRETAVIDAPKCTWKSGADNPKSTVFQRIRENGPSDPYFKCFSCIGIDFQCDIYKEYLKEMSSDF